LEKSKKDTDQKNDEIKEKTKEYEQTLLQIHEKEKKREAQQKKITLLKKDIKQ